MSTVPTAVSTAQSATGGGDAADQATAGAPRPALPVVTVVARRTAAYQVEDDHAGRVVARRSSALGFSRGGLISRIAVDDGDPVAAGQMLAWLDTRALEAKAVELETELDQRRSSLDAAVARVEQAAAIETRRSQLARRDWVSKEAYDDAVFDHKQAVAEQKAAESAIRTAEAALASLQVDLELSRLTAPYAGTVIARRIDEGAAVTPGQPVLDLIETDVLEFRVGVPVATAATLAVGTDYPVIIAEKQLSGRLIKVLPVVEAETRTVIAIFTLPEAEPAPIAGQLGHLRLGRTIPTAGFWLPLAALTESHRGLWAAYVVEPAPAASDTTGVVGTLSRRELQLFQVDANRAYVGGVLRDGEPVVADGTHRLIPGMRVRDVGAGR